MRVELVMNAIAVIAAKSGFFLLTLMAYEGMSKEAFADYGVLVLLYSTVVGVLGQAMQLTANKYVAMEVDLRSFSRASTLLSVCCSFLAASYSYLIYEKGLLVSASLGAATFYGVLLSYYAGFFYGAGSRYGSAFIYGGQLLVLLLAGWWGRSSVENLFLYIAVGMFLLACLGGLFVPRRLGSGGVVHWRVIMSSVTLPLILAGVASSVVFLVLVEVIRLGPSFAEDMTAFTLANQARMLVATIPLFFGNVILRQLATNQKASVRLNYYSAIIPSLLITLLLCALWGEFSEGGHAYALGVLFLYGTVITSFKAGIGRNIVAKGLGKISIYSNVTWSVLFIACCYFSYDVGYGVVGVGYSFLLSHVLHYAVFRGVFIKSDVLQIKETDPVLLASVAILGLSLVSDQFQWASAWKVVFAGLFLFVVYKELRKT